MSRFETVCALLGLVALCVTSGFCFKHCEETCRRAIESKDPMAISKVCVGR